MTPSSTTTTFFFHDFTINSPQQRNKQQITIAEDKAAFQPFELESSSGGQKKRSLLPT